MLFYHELLDYVNAHRDFGNRLKQPLRQTIIRGDMSIASEKLPHGGEPPTRSLSKDADWNAALDISDTILQSRSAASKEYEQEEDFSGVRMDPF